MSLELCIFEVKLFNSLFEVSDVLGFLGGEVVKGINDGVSEFVKGINDLLDDVLVGEVLVGGQTDEGLDHGGHLASLGDLSLDVLEGVLELLDLDQRGVGQSGNQGKSLVDGSGGSVEFFNLSLVVGVLLLSDEGVLLESLSVLFLVVSDVFNLGLELGSSGEEEVLDDVVSSVDGDGSILDILFKGDHKGVVLIGSDLEVVF